MTMTLQELSDRMEIQDLLVRYSHAIDTRQWHLLDQVFTPDAHIDYTAMGGDKGNLSEIKAFLDKSFKMFSASQHMITNSAVELDGDEATGRTMCHNPMVFRAEDGGDGQVFYCGLWYLDRLVRTPEGWRIRERVEEKSYFFNTPEGLPTGG